MVLGIQIGGQARAFPLAKVRAASLIEDRVGGVPVALVVGPDGESVRVFRSQWNGMDIELYRDTQTQNKDNGRMAEWRLLDAQGNTWNFSGLCDQWAGNGAVPAKNQFSERLLVRLEELQSANDGV